MSRKIRGTYFIAQKYGNFEKNTDGTNARKNARTIVNYSLSSRLSGARKHVPFIPVPTCPNFRTKITTDFLFHKQIECSLRASPSRSSSGTPPEDRAYE